MTEVPPTPAIPLDYPPGQFVVLDYTNYRGDRSQRVVAPVAPFLRYGTSKWHPNPGWLLIAYDPKKGEVREFAMRWVHSWH